MIGRLFGKLASQDEDGSLVIDVSGVGYEILAPLGTHGRIQLDVSGREVYFVHTHVREDALILFGFATERERMTFRMLISVSNIGPKTAIAILSALSPDDLARAVALEEIERLTAVSGIGKKTAERVVLELRGKLWVDAAAEARPKLTSAVVKSGKSHLLLSALTNMGYRSNEAERAVAQLKDKTGENDPPLADLVKDALLFLSR